MSGAATSGELSATDREAVLELARHHKPAPGSLLEILHAVQARFSYVPAASLALIAAELNLSRAEVHGVVSFYHYFRTRPPGRRRLQLCRAEACQAMQGRALAAHAQVRLGIDFGGTADDGSASLDAVYCLGLCALAPAIMLDGRVHARMTPQRLDELLAVPAHGDSA